MADNVNHPAHYEASTSLECIEAMELMFGKQAVYDYCICNAYKYIWRHRNKNGLEDLNKAEWYLNKASELQKESDLYLGDEDDRYRLYKTLSDKRVEMKQWQE